MSVFEDRVVGNAHLRCIGELWQTELSNDFICRGSARALHAAAVTTTACDDKDTEKQPMMLGNKPEREELDLSNLQITTTPLTTSAHG